MFTTVAFQRIMRCGGKRVARIAACAAVASGAVAVHAGSAAVPARATASAYVTPLMAHTAWTATSGCKPFPGVVTLPNVLKGHASHGYTLTGTIITDWVHSTTRNCIESLPLLPYPKPILLPSWTDLKSLRTTYPWFDLTSAGKDYADMTTMTQSQWKTEACGSASIISGEGVPTPLPLFAYPNNHHTTAMNTFILANCPYVLGRRYASKANTPTTVTSGFLNVYSINGGHCTDTSLPCSTLATDYAYTPESTLYAEFHPAAGTWIVPQFYRLVSGTSTTGRLQWNCTGAESSHYTYDTGGNSTELYCANDYYTALSNQPSYVVTNKNIRQVETAWGLK
jgi:hypothetical protein